MKLTIPERYALLDLLPKEGTYTTLKIVRQARENLSFSEAELAAFNLVETLTPDHHLQVTFNPTAEAAEIDLGLTVRELVATALRKLDAEGKLTDREFSLYEKFEVH